MEKQKIVMKVSMEDAKKRSKAMKIAVGLPGVISAALEGDQRDRLVVVGEEIDSVTLTILLRKQMRLVELVSVAPVEEKKPPAAAGDKKQPEEAGAKNVQPVFWPYQGVMVPPYQYEIRDNNYDPNCCIM